MTIFSKNENNAIENRDNRAFWRWSANMSKLVRYGVRVKRGRRDWAGGAPPCRSPVADRICTSRAHGEKFSILAQGVNGEMKRRSMGCHGGSRAPPALERDENDPSLEPLVSPMGWGFTAKIAKNAEDLNTRKLRKLRGEKSQSCPQMGADGRRLRRAESRTLKIERKLAVSAGVLHETCRSSGKNEPNCG